ncbi:MAG: ABC transporter ATP-binding protein, partial [Alphaproteobacteria bacterium]|nr:ABC transporter ATP-binding protein [Alphaproteobacteria bacterium]
MPGVIAGARKSLLIGLCGLAFVQSGIAVATALSVAAIAKALLTQTPLSEWAITIAALAVPFAAACRWAERVQAEKLGQSYVETIRKRFIRRALQTPATALAGRAHGAMMLRFTGDMGALRNWAARGLARLVVGGTTLAAGAAALLWLDPIIGLTFVA